MTADPWAAVARMAAEAAEDNARALEVPAFVGTMDELEGWLARADVDDAAWLAARLSPAEAASIVASEDGTDPLVPWPDSEGLQEGGESGSVIALRAGARPETPSAATGGVSHVGGAVTLRRCQVAPSCERPAGHEGRCEPDQGDELERLRLLFAAGRCWRWQRVDGHLVDLLLPARRTGAR